MSDRWLERSEGEEIDNWNTVYCSHIQGNMSKCAYSRTLFAFITIFINLPQRAGSKLRISWYIVPSLNT